MKEEGSRGPGRKRRRLATVVTVARTRGVLPPADQDENVNLVGAAEVARILGYSTADRFISGLGHGLLPELEQPDGYEYRRGSGGRPRQQRGKRSRLEDPAARRSSPS